MNNINNIFINNDKNNLKIIKYSLNEIKNLLDLSFEINEQNDNVHSFFILNITKNILDNKKGKLTFAEKEMKNEINNVINSIIERPEYYFNSKENNIQKLIDTKKSLNCFPKIKQEKIEIRKNLNINTINKLYNNIIKNCKDAETINYVIKNKNSINKLLKSNLEQNKYLKDKTNKLYNELFNKLNINNSKQNTI